MAVPPVPGRSAVGNRTSSLESLVALSEGNTLYGLPEVSSVAHGAMLAMGVEAEGGSFDIEGTRPAEVSSVERSLR